MSIINNPMEFEENITIRKKIHLNITKRNARKYITSIEGLEEKDFEKGLKFILKKMKKNFSCNGSIDKTTSTVQFQGDQRDNIKSYLIEKFDFSEEDIIIHGV
jgi:translation initiation factor SUI1